MEIFLLLLACILLPSSDAVDVFQSCSNVHGRNLSDLQGIWEVHQLNNDSSTSIYHLSICSSLPSTICSGTSSICKQGNTNTGTGLSFGDFDKPPNITATSESAVSFYLEYNTTRHCATRNGVSYAYRSSITFECSTTLGSPEVISADECSVDFLWETSKACRPSEYDATKEVRCYAFDSNDKKRDLNSLIKQMGGYLITDPESKSTASDGLYINVCRDIKSVSGDEAYPKVGNCPSGSAACLVTGGHSYSLGVPGEAVNMTSEGRLVLAYEFDGQSGNTKPPQCGSFTPQVIITFVCPGTTRGGSKPPIITSSLNCQYTVEWWTEAACPADFVRSNNECGLDIQKHGIELDLTPLTSATQVSTVGSDGATYLLNVCGGIHVGCTGLEQSGAHAEVAVCQSNKNGVGFKAGLVNDYQVQYVDNELSITYKNGQRCNSNGLRRRSIIIFHCNKTAGIGSPAFSHELHCTYYFDWQTVHACVSQPTCHVTDSQGQTFDLSPLTKINGGGDVNWEVLKSGEAGKRYFINMCGEVLRDRVTTPCPPGAAVCRLEADNHVSFGSYAHYNLTRQNNKLVMFYSQGDVCSSTGVRRTTKITLYCRPGDLEGSPVFKYLSSDDCQISLTWYTAAACPLKAVTGTNCMVSDEESGLTFDLRRLTKSTKESMYKVSTSQYTYSMNVCNKLVGSPCNKPNNDNPGACQVEIVGSNRAYTIGQASETLVYYNGFVKLLYKDGDSYRNHLHNRSTQISFLCDTKAGGGKPQFVSESNYTYLFNWYTSYVCPAASVQCMVTDPKTGDQYDLSRLAKSEDDEDANWSVMAGTENEETRKKKYYLNVCRPVNEVRGSQEMECDALAGACQTSIDSNGQEQIEFASLGRPTSAPVIESPGHLLLKYTNGSKCTDNGKPGTFTTTIHFVCQKGQLSSSPRYLASTGCLVSFMWNTEAACAITSNQGIMNNTECEVSSSNTAYTFNLQPLKRDAGQPYVVTGGGSTYEINVCGNVTDCRSGQSTNTAGCKKISDGHFEQSVASHSAPSYSDNGDLYIDYTSLARTSDFQFIHYKISFICNRAVTRGKPTFNSVDGNYVLFDFQTSLACQPDPVDCLVTDDFGNQYDLTPLSQSDKPWTFVDTPNNRSFYISVCRPLPPVDGCSGSGFGACFVAQQTNGGKVEGHGLGLVQSNPSAASDASVNSAVTLTYMGGDVCKRDTKRRYSTRILFQCSEDEGASPVLQPNNDPCEFLFAWRTPAACPVTKVRGQECKVTEPLYHMTFDLSPLTRGTDYTVSTGGEWNFNVNICSGLKQATGACKDSGSCQVASSGDAMHDAGKPSSNLTYEDGVITLEYLHGEKCHQNRFERSSVFRFTCNHEDNEASSIGRPTFINESADCTYHFDWPTAKVCPPIKIVGCTATHHMGENYDLSSLSLANSNYMASTRGDTGGRSYYINVCRTLLHQAGVTCPPNSASCMKKGKKYTSLGTITNGPEFNGDTLRLVYTDGDRCASDTTRNYSTVITFQCSETAALDTTPVVVDGDSCTVQMLWVTKAACALGSSSTPSSSDKPCKAVNTETDHTFDLSGLESSSGYKVVTHDGRSFNINICQKLHTSNCPDGTGSCLAEQRNGPYSSAGRASSQLTYNEGALSLHYSNGSTCPPDSRYKQSTTISFVCHRSNAPHLQQPTKAAMSPVFVGEDKDTCSYYFSWHTHLACEEQFPCAVVSLDTGAPKVYDLSSLIPETGNYMAVGGEEGNRTVYFISVCRPLEPIDNINCPPGASVCAAKHGTNPQSLGYINPKKRHIFYKNGSVVLEYTSGRPCPAKGDVNISTRIVFKCMPNAGKGSPSLMAVTDDCVYLFEWPTAVVCLEGGKVPATSDACKFTDPTNNFVYDLSKIPSVDIKTSTAHYRLSPCNSLTSATSVCRDSSACRVTTDGTSYSIGKSSTRKISGGESKDLPVQVTYTDGDKCLTSKIKATTILMFRCDRNENEVTVVEDEATCRYHVYWPTPHVCPPPEKSCMATDPLCGATYDLSLLSSMTHAWTFSDNDKNRYYLNLCRNMPQSKCNENATFCRKLKSTNKIQNIGVVSTQSITVQSKNKLLVRYAKGESGICSDPDKSASVEISLTCDPSISALPTFDKVNNKDCVFHINWRTRIACEDEPKKITIDKTGKFVDPKSGETIDLSPIINKSWTVTSDLRQDGDKPTYYEYVIDMKGQPGSGRCDAGTTVCQFDPKGTFKRTVGALQPAPTYTITDESLEIMFKSNDRCGRDTTKRSHSLLSLRCSGNKKVGQPMFVYESTECGYFFEWYTSVMCVNVQSNAVSPPPTNPTPSMKNQTSIHEVADRHNQSATVVAVVFSSLAIVCILILVFHSAARRRSFSRSVKKFCGFGTSPSNYRYIRSGDDEDGVGLFDDMDDLQMQQETSLLGGGQRMHGATNTDSSPVPLAPIGGAVADDVEDDLFAVPDVNVKTSKRGKAPKQQKGKSKTKRRSPNPFEESDSDDLLPFLKDKKPPQSRAPGVGGEKKVETYHDEDDEDLLEDNTTCYEIQDLQQSCLKLRLSGSLSVE